MVLSGLVSGGGRKGSALLALGKGRTTSATTVVTARVARAGALDHNPQPDAVSQT